MQHERRVRMAVNFTLRDGEGNVDPKLYDETAEKIAGSLIEEQQGPRGRPIIVGVKRHQFRRIFDEIKRLRRMLDQKGDDAWSDIYPHVKLAKSKIAYSVSRAAQKREKKYYDELYAFIKVGIDKIKEPEDLRVFTLLLEAVYGFYYQKGGSET
jgi:CRISPR type III-A-associated protein Csm2